MYCTAWHYGDALNQAAIAFHDKHATQPTSAIKENQPMLDKIKKDLEEYFRMKGIWRHIEYTGSSYEQVKVSKSANDADIEYDLMIILVNTSILSLYLKSLY